MEQTNCLLCGADDADPLLRRECPRHVVCRRCGLVYQNPRPTHDEMAAHYAQGYWEERGLDDEYQGTSSEQSIDRGNAIVEWTRSYVRPTDLIVEGGCGHGEILAHVRDQLGCTAIGVEPSQSQAVAARRRFDLEMINADLDSVDFGEQRPKLLILSHVLEHFHDPRAALRRCAELLPDDGLLFIEVPNILHPHPRKRLSSWLAFEHMTYFSPGTLRRMLSELGFRILNEEQSTFVRLLAQKSNSTALSPMPRESSAVRRALRKHEIQYWPAYVFRRAFGKLLHRRTSAPVKMASA
jgi:SAM-dependent methyltransferase